MAHKAWIITAEYNDYDQHGSYFVAWFREKPTFQDIKKLLPYETDATIGKLTRGGGRQGSEYKHYNLIHPVETTDCQRDGE